MSTDDWNSRIIEEFRSNNGKVGGPFAEMPILLLHTVGAKSGEPRIHPLAYQALDGKYAIFASYAGAPKNPAWFHNLTANPEVTVEIEDRTETVVARILGGDERDRIWEQQKKLQPGFADYEAKTDREIPVIVLEPAA